LQQAAVDAQVGLAEQAAGGQRDLGRDVGGAARRPEDLCRRVAGKDPTPGHEQVRSA